MPRKPSCECGTCAKCRFRIKQRELYASLSREERRALVERRDPERVRANDRARYERDTEKRRAAMDDYARRNPGVVKAAKQRWVEGHPAARKAHSAVSNAIRDGRLEKGPCEMTGPDCKGRIEAHHDDYSKPLDVRWLCSHHHAQLRRRYEVAA